MRHLVSLVALAALSGACAGGPPADAPDLVGTSWQLVSVDGKPSVPNADVRLNFTADGVTGHTGINRFHGNWSWSGDGIEFGPMATTRAAGPPAMMQQENRVLIALEGAERVRVDGDQLIIGTEEKDVLVFDRVQ